MINNVPTNNPLIANTAAETLDNAGQALIFLQAMLADNNEVIDDFSTRKGLSHMMQGVILAVAHAEEEIRARGGEGGAS